MPAFSQCAMQAGAGEADETAAPQKCGNWVATGKQTPAMACITDVKDSAVRLPPDGRSPASLPAPLDFALGLPLTAAAGSDVPWGSTIGEVRTYVHTGQDELSLDAWFAGLKAGRTFVSNGPVLEFTVDGQLPGSRIDCPPGKRLKETAKAHRGHAAVGLPKALTVVSNEGVLKEAVAAEGAAELRLQLEVEMTCTNNALAHSSPVYAIVNGRPHWCPKRGPAVIDKQLAAMDKIAGEFKGDDPRSRGIPERMDNARRYYADLRAKMAAQEGVQQ